MLWKINFKDIVFLMDKTEKRRASLASLGSLSAVSHQSHITTNEETQQAIQQGKQQIAHVHEQLVWVKTHDQSFVLTNETDHMHLKQMRDMSHENLNAFIGLCLDAHKPHSAWRFAAKGSVEDICGNENIKLDWFFKYSILKDFANGMDYIHQSDIKTHGRLKDSNCVIDSRWVGKITDFGPHKLRACVTELKPFDQLWTAPEILRLAGAAPLDGTQKGDIYAFGIIMGDMIMRDHPWGHDQLAPEEVLPRIRKDPPEKPPCRPTVEVSPKDGVDPAALALMASCLDEDAEKRPDFNHVKVMFRQMGRGKNSNLLDHVMKMMEKYAANLEATVNERTEQLMEEMEKTDALLYRMLPRAIADKLKTGEPIDPENFEAVTIFFSDVVGFTTIAGKSTPPQVVTLLNKLYMTFDDILNQHDVYKVETIGDGYMCASGVPERNGNQHAAEMANMALQTMATLQTFQIPHLKERKLELRIGLHTGPVVAGMVGTVMPRYCLFGDTVFVANRMESNGSPSQIHISEECNRYLTKVISPPYITKARGEIIVKGAGVLFTYWLEGAPTETAAKVAARKVINEAPVAESHPTTEETTS